LFAKALSLDANHADCHVTVAQVSFFNLGFSCICKLMDNFLLDRFH
jgi:hypothetical protein